MKIDKIPLHILFEDRQSSIFDIGICEMAMANGASQYSGGSIQDRKTGNEQIIERIDVELERRSAL